MNEDIQKILLDQVEFLKREIVVKNTLIENLILEVYNKKPRSEYANESVSRKSLYINEKSLLNDLSCGNINESNSLTIGDNEIEERTIGSENNPLTNSSDIIHPDKIQVLINDSNSSFENEFYAAKINISHKSPMRNRSKIEIKSPRSAYSKAKEHGKKTLLLSDSILSRVQMRLFNKELKKGRAYRKYFPGATPTNIAHYCLPTLKKR